MQHLFIMEKPAKSHNANDATNTPMAKANEWRNYMLFGRQKRVAIEQHKAKGIAANTCVKYMHYMARPDEVHPDAFLYS